MADVPGAAERLAVESMAGVLEEVVTVVAEMAAGAMVPRPEDTEGTMEAEASQGDAAVEADVALVTVEEGQPVVVAALGRGEAPEAEVEA